MYLALRFLGKGIFCEKELYLNPIAWNILEQTKQLKQSTTELHPWVMRLLSDQHWLWSSSRQQAMTTTAQTGKQDLWEQPCQPHHADGLMSTVSSRDIGVETERKDKKDIGGRDRERKKEKDTERTLSLEISRSVSISSSWVMNTFPKVFYTIKHKYKQVNIYIKK